MRAMLILGTTFSAVALGVMGCSANLSDARFTCGPGVDCPPGLACRGDGRCYRGAVVADAASGDSGSDSGSDSGATDAGAIDTGLDGGSIDSGIADAGACSASCGWACVGSACDAPVQVVAGGEFACALRTSGVLDCWGYNGKGDLDDGTTATSNVPIASGGTLRASQFDLGNDHGCAISSADGRVLCWGANDSGQLGTGTTSASPTPATGVVDAGGTAITGALAVAAGFTHTCALLSDYTVACWGANGNGQLGDGTVTTSPRPRAGPVVGLPAGHVAEIAAGAMHTCARMMADRSVWCWGSDDSGQLGDNDLSAMHASPVAVMGITDALRITAGYDYTCAVRTDHTAWCWGQNFGRQLGDGTTTSRGVPVAVASLPAEVDEIDAGIGDSSGRGHTCAHLMAGGVYCWGSNADGQLGSGVTGAPPVHPAMVSGLSVAHVSAGLDATCAIERTTGRVRCWGGNGYGQLGYGTTGGAPHPAPDTVVVAPP